MKLKRLSWEEMGHNLSDSDLFTPEKHDAIRIPQVVARQFQPMKWEIVQNRNWPTSWLAGRETKHFNWLEVRNGNSPKWLRWWPKTCLATAMKPNRFYFATWIEQSLRRMPFHCCELFSNIFSARYCKKKVAPSDKCIVMKCSVLVSLKELPRLRARQENDL